MATPASRVVGVERISLAMRQLTADQEHELSGELDQLSQLIARRMRQKAPVGVAGILRNGIQVSSPDRLVRDIGPTADYAVPVHDGVRAGGKGLPRFDSPGASDIRRWLETMAFTRAGRKNVRGARRELELRDRYQALAWSIRRRGIKARPFAQQAFDEMAPVVEVRLQAAAEGVMRGSTS